MAISTTTTTEARAPSESKVEARSRSIAGVISTVISTGNSLTPTILRIGMAIVYFPHGLQKVFGMYGGVGFHGTMGMFTQQMGIPALFAFLAIFTELLAPIALFFGFATRVAALLLAVEMIIAMLMVHLPNGFFMNWNGQQAGEGFEYHILAITIGIALCMAGGGRYSIDRMLKLRTLRT
jgi:putative oxidoreductase